MDTFLVLNHKSLYIILQLICALLKSFPFVFQRRFKFKTTWGWINDSFFGWTDCCISLQDNIFLRLHPESDRAGYVDLDYKGNADISLNVSLCPPGVFRSGNILCSFTPHTLVFLKHKAFFLPHSLFFGVSSSLSSSVFFLLHREQGKNWWEEGFEE